MVRGNPGRCLRRTGDFVLADSREGMMVAQVGPFLGIQLEERLWNPLEVGTFRVNVDSSFHPIKNEFGVGVIVQDSVDKIMLESK